MLPVGAAGALTALVLVLWFQPDSDMLLDFQPVLMRFYLLATVLLCGCVTIEVVPAHQLGGPRKT